MKLTKQNLSERADRVYDVIVVGGGAGGLSVGIYLQRYLHFSVYLEHAPGSMFRLGVGFKDRILNYPLHHPLFDVDESAIITGVVTMAYTAYKYWQEV
ncbi:hypothetical protein NUACC21_13710 [Scytonema sp. NUACC21]